MKNPIIFYLKSSLSFNVKNLIRVFSLVLGLSLSLVLFGEVVYEQSFDNFHKDLDRIYALQGHYTVNDTGIDATRVPMAVVPKFVKEIPEIQTGTTYGDRIIAYKLGENVFDMKGLYVDTAFFDVFSVDLLQGNPKEDFLETNSIYLSESKAKELFGDENPMGKTILRNSNNAVRTVKGIFKDIPKNSTLGSIKFFESFSYNLEYIDWFVGNDSYMGFLKLNKGADINLVNEKIKEISIKNNNMPGVTAIYYAIPFRNLFSYDPQIVKMCLMMTLMVVVLLFVSALNYSLITISSLSTRMKEIAIHKCNGASSRIVFSMILGETAIYIFVALALSVLVLYGLRDYIAQFLTGTFENIFVLENLWGSVIVIIFLLLVSAVIPAKIFSSIPAMAIFRTNNSSNQLWKKSILLFQFIATISVVSISGFLVKQYDFMLNRDLGYECGNLTYVQVGVNGNNIEMFRDELKSLDFVDDVCFGKTIFLWGANNGTNIMEGKNSLFNSRIFTFDSHFVETHNIKLLEGRVFRDDTNSEIMVDPEFVKKMNLKEGESIINKKIEIGISIDSSIVATVVGVMDNIDINDSFYKVNAPFFVSNIKSEMSPNTKSSLFAIVKFNKINAQNIGTLKSKIEELLPDEIQKEINTFNQAREWKYSSDKSFLIAVIVAGFIIMLVSIMGLYGYISNELLHKNKEIALRKFAGAEVSNIIFLIFRPILKLLCYAIPFGVIIAYLASNYYIKQNFLHHTELSWWVYAITLIFVIVFVFVVVFMRTYKVAQQNPINALRSGNN